MMVADYICNIHSNDHRWGVMTSEGEQGTAVELALCQHGEVGSATARRRAFCAIVVIKAAELKGSSLCSITHMADGGTQYVKYAVDEK